MKKTWAYEMSFQQSSSCIYTPNCLQIGFLSTEIAIHHSTKIEKKSGSFLNTCTSTINVRFFSKSLVPDLKFFRPYDLLMPTLANVCVGMCHNICLNINTNISSLTRVWWCFCFSLFHGKILFLSYFQDRKNLLTIWKTLLIYCITIREYFQSSPKILVNITFRCNVNGSLLIENIIYWKNLLLLT